MDNEIINKIQEALEQYDQSWDEWLNSDACFLNAHEVKAIGYLLAFQCVEETARLLKKSQDEYLLILEHTVEKLKNQHFQYKAWLTQKVIMNN
jgi:hypothetical protein